MNYADIGVDIDLTNQLLKNAQNDIKKTVSPSIIISNNDFCACVEHNSFLEKFSQQNFVYSVDGVGSKLILAQKYSNYFSNVAKDLFGMVFNDIICSGATPLYLLDYYGTHSIREKHLTDIRFTHILTELTRLCRLFGVALIGGETAEIPSLYKRNKYDLVGFGVGVVESDKKITRDKVKKNDVIIGVRSSGPHSNGFSLLNKLVKKYKNEEFIRAILKPTIIYIPVVNMLRSVVDIHGIAHITGGGIDNISRIIPNGLQANIDFSKWEIPELFKEIQAQANMTETELRRTFNCGIGMVFIVDKQDVDISLETIQALSYHHFDPIVIGTVRA